MTEDRPQDPGVLRNIGHGWKRIAKRVGNFQARMLLSLFYFLLLAPFALMFRLTSKIGTGGARSAGNWLPKSDPEGQPLDRARTQY